MTERTPFRERYTFENFRPCEEDWRIAPHTFVHWRGHLSYFLGLYLGEGFWLAAGESTVFWSLSLRNLIANAKSWKGAVEIL